MDQVEKQEVPLWLVLAPVAALVVLLGSSWTTAGTVGLALIGIAQVMGLSPEITAGAVISGAYFGDKMSPLSDTTNLAPTIRIRPAEPAPAPPPDAATAGSN